MKGTISFIILLVSLTLSSCAIQKRQHLKGFYFPQRSHYKVDHEKSSDRSTERVIDDEWNEVGHINTSTSDKESAYQSYTDELALNTNNVSTNTEYANSSARQEQRASNDKESILTVTKNKSVAVPPINKELHPGAKTGAILTGVSIAAFGGYFLIPLIGLVIPIAMIASIFFAFIAIKDIKAEPRIWTGLNLAKGVLYFWGAVILTVVVLLIVL